MTENPSVKVYGPTSTDDGMPLEGKIISRQQGLLLDALKHIDSKYGEEVFCFFDFDAGPVDGCEFHAPGENGSGLTSVFERMTEIYERSIKHNVIDGERTDIESDGAATNNLPAPVVRPER